MGGCYVPMTAEERRARTARGIKTPAEFKLIPPRLPPLNPPDRPRFEGHGGWGLLLPRSRFRPCAAPSLAGFGTFEVLSDAPIVVELEKQLATNAARAIAEMRTAYVRGAVKIGLIAGLTAPLWSVLGTANVKNTIQANYVVLGRRVDLWATKLRDAAERGFHLENGQRADVYTWTRWADFGRDLGKEIGFQTKLIWDANPLNVALDAVKETFRQLNPSNPAAWPLWLKVVLVGGGLVAGAYVVGTGVKAVQLLRGR